MNKSRIFDLNLKEWSSIREELTEKVNAKSLIPKEWTNVTVSLTRVDPKGEFRSHIDSYHHVFYFIQGNGIGFVNDEEYKINSGIVVEIPAGIKHGYKNTSDEDLILITINIPI